MATVRLMDAPAFSAISFLQYLVGNENSPFRPLICLSPDLPLTISDAGSSPRNEKLSGAMLGGMVTPA